MNCFKSIIHPNGFKKIDFYYRDKLNYFLSSSPNPSHQSEGSFVFLNSMTLLLRGGGDLATQAYFGLNNRLKKVHPMGEVL